MIWWTYTNINIICWQPSFYKPLRKKQTTSDKTCNPFFSATWCACTPSQLTRAAIKRRSSLAAVEGTSLDWIHCVIKVTHARLPTCINDDLWLQMYFHNMYRMPEMLLINAKFTWVRTTRVMLDKGQQPSGSPGDRTSATNPVEWPAAPSSFLLLVASKNAPSSDARSP